MNKVTGRPRVAIVHDWLTVMGGAEQVVLELHRLYPDAPIFTSVYDKAALPAFANLDVRTTWMQKVLPKPLRYKHILWPVLRAYAFRGLDLSDYDLVISSASAEAKSVRKAPGATHVCYCHTPIRYYWSHYDEFKREFDFGRLTPLIRPFIPAFVRWMRRLDRESVSGVDAFIANSTVTQERIKKYYERPSTVIYPPVDIRKFSGISTSERHGYVIWGRHVPYKRFDTAIEACNKLGVPLSVIGSGPDTARLKSLAGPTVTFTGRVSDAGLVARAHAAKAFLFPGEEDFGISAVEAISAGLPVIGYAKGGIRDIITDGKTGVLYEPQSVDGLVNAMTRAEMTNFMTINLTNRSKHFSVSLFATKFSESVARVIHSKK